MIPSSSTLGEASAGQLAELAEAIEQHDVPAIFTERLGSASEAEALAKRLGVDVVELDSDSLGVRRSGGDVHRHDARQRGGDRAALQ